MATTWDSDSNFSALQNCVVSDGVSITKEVIDDFTGSSLDTGIWNTVNTAGGSIVVADGALQLSGGGNSWDGVGVISKNAINIVVGSTITIRAKVSAAVNVAWGCGVNDTTLDYTANGFYIYPALTTYVLINGAFASTGVATITNTYHDYIWTFTYNGFTVHRDATLLYEYTGGNVTGNTYYYTANLNSATNTCYIDKVTGGYGTAIALVHDAEAFSLDAGYGHAWDGTTFSQVSDIVTSLITDYDKSDLAINYRVFADVFVSQSTGSDVTGDGSSSNPYATITKAIAEASADDVIEVLGTTHTEQGILVNKTLTIQGCEACNTIVQANAASGTATDRVFRITAADTIIRDMTIRHGNPSSTNTGGGISIEAADVTIDNCVIEDNIAYRGGGIDLQSTGAVISNCVIDGNEATQAYGGGIAVYHYQESTSATISNCAIINNSVTGATPLQGGGGVCAAYNDGDTTSCVIVNCTISGNSSTGEGGGIYTGFTGSDTTGNSLLQVYNSTIANNTCNKNGGGVFNRGGSDTVNLYSTIISGNTATLSGDDFDGDVQTSDYCLILDTTGANLISDTNGQHTKDPLLATLANNGGTTYTHAITNQSPAYNNGSNPLSESYDQRGLGYPRAEDTSVDIGAFELTKRNLRYLNYSRNRFFETESNNGSIDNDPPLVITAVEVAFSGANDDDFVADGKVVVTNLPDGLTAVLTRTSSTTLELALTGNASAHLPENNVTDLTLTFQVSAFDFTDIVTIQYADYSADQGWESASDVDDNADWNGTWLGIAEADDTNLRYRYLKIRAVYEPDVSLTLVSVTGDSYQADVTPPAVPTAAKFAQFSSEEEDYVASVWIEPADADFSHCEIKKANGSTTYYLNDVGGVPTWQTSEGTYWEFADDDATKDYPKPNFVDDEYQENDTYYVRSVDMVGNHSAWQELSLGSGMGGTFVVTSLTLGL